MIKISSIKKFINTLVLVGILILSVLITFINAKLNMTMYGLIIISLIFALITNRKALNSKTVLVLFIMAVYPLIITLFSFGFDFQLLWRTVRIPFTILIGFFYARKTYTSDRKILYSIIYVLILVSIAYGFYEKAMGLGWGYNSRMDSFYGQPIVYGNILCFAFWMTFFLFKNSIAKWVFTVYILAGLLSTGSRSAWLGLLFSIILLLYNQMKNTSITKTTFIRLILFCLAFIVYIFTPSFQNIYETIFARFSGLLEDGSAIQRLGSYPIVLSNFITANPFSILLGYGTSATGNLMGNNVVLINDFHTADNQYLAILFDYGIVGIAIALYTIYITVSSNISLSIKNNEIEIRMITSCLSSTFICAIFYDFYGWLSISTLFCLFLGVFLWERKKHLVYEE